MIKIPRFYIILLLLSISLFVLFEWIKPRDVSWETTFSSRSNMPYGTYVIANLLPQLFPDQQIRINKNNYYDLFNNLENANVIIIHNAFETDEYSIDAMLESIKNGSEVFISANNFNQYLLDTLGLNTLEYWGDELEFNFVSKPFMVDSNYILEYKYSTYFELDSCLVYNEIGNLVYDDFINFIRVDIGQGTLFLNTNPLAFTNYSLLTGNNRDYVEKAFSMMEVRDIVWDEYLQIQESSHLSTLQYIANNPSLRNAYYIGTILLFLFAVFYGKRRQKSIPIIAPLKNDSLEFAETISSLYLQQKKHKNITDKRIMYFFDNINHRYHIKSRILDEDLIQKLILRTSKSEDEIKELITSMQKIRNAKKVSDKELLRFNKKLEDFYN